MYATTSSGGQPLHPIYVPALERGLSFTVTAGNIITLPPPLTVTREDLDRALGILENSLTAVEQAAPPPRPRAVRPTGGEGMSELYFEDFSVGHEFRTPGLTVTESAIIHFAERFDRQPFHLDVQAAKETPFGGLIASGIHTIAVTFSLFIQTGAIAACSLGSPGLDEVRWLVPVRPGDTLRVEIEVVAARPSSSKPDRGIVTLSHRTLNQRDETVMTMRSHQLLRRRPA